jgi:hypothetical protein
VKRLKLTEKVPLRRPYMGIWLPIVNYL